MKGSISYKSRIANRSREGSRETVALCDKFWLADPRGTHGSSSSPNKGPLILIVAWYHLLSSWWYGVCLWAMNGLDHAVSWNWRLEPPRNGLLREGEKTFRVSLEIPWILSLRNIEDTSDYDFFNRFFWGLLKLWVPLNVPSERKKNIGETPLVHQVLRCRSWSKLTPKTGLWMIVDIVDIVDIVILVDTIVILVDTIVIF